MIRVYELLYLTFSTHALPSIFGITSGLNFDAFFVFASSFLLLPFFLIVAFVSSRLVALLYGIYALLIVFLHIIFSQFFLTTGELLSNIFLQVSYAEIKQISSAELSLQRADVWLMYLLIPVPVAWFFLFRFNKVILLPRVQNVLVTVYLILFLVIFKNLNHFQKSVEFFPSYYDYYAGNNKLVYFANSIYKAKAEEDADKLLTKAEISEYIKDFQKLNPGFNYYSQQYPLLHNEQYPNVLGQFFDSSETKPNIVFLIVEGLSGEFCGKNTYVGHFTPFVDSLINHSLYWDHFLSNAEFSYGALPHILASSVYGPQERGIINMKHRFPNQKAYPKHNSILNLVEQNGYRTRFFYGGEPSFDNLMGYTSQQGIDYMLDATKFNTNKYHQLVHTNGTLGWGYNDKDLFNQAKEIVDATTGNNPYLDTYVTLSLHSPFELFTDDYKEEAFLRKRLSPRNKNYNEIVKTINKGVLSATVFTDDALQQFFNIYKKRKEFNNTIFIITGDHRVADDIPSRSMIDLYHVPLIIYSPLLKHSRTFKGLCSHIDIVPSLIELLKSNYGLKFQYSQHWMGSGLDTSAVYRNNKSFSLSLFNTSQPSFLHHNYMLIGDEVWKIDEHFAAKLEKDKTTVDSIKLRAKTYRVINKVVCREDRICD